MAHGDVSFTFVSRIDEIEENLNAGHLQSALALALTLPDICGGIAFPEYTKKYRDGKVMKDRNGEPTRDIGRQYIQWIDTYAAPFLKKNPEDTEAYLSRERCWQLRCEYLHQNKGFDNEDLSLSVHFHLGMNCGSSVCHLDTEENAGDKLHIRLDIEELCKRLSLAARQYYEENKETKNFALYNTPVIDFIKWQDESFSDQKILAILTRDKIYGNGLQIALQGAYRQVAFGTSWEEVKKRLKKGKADIWIAEEEFLPYLLKEREKDRSVRGVLLGDHDANTWGNPAEFPYIDKTMALKEIRKKIRALG